MKTLNKKRSYTVWVGGTEVNDNYMTLNDAKKLAFEYEIEGYEPVIQKITLKN